MVASLSEWKKTANMMNRKVFLKALAALGLSGRLPKGDEVPKLANVTTRLSYRPDDARLREEHIRHEIRSQCPSYQVLLSGGSDAGANGGEERQ